MKQEKGFKSTYTKEGERIYAKYDLDERYHRFVVRLNSCKTEKQRRLVADVPYQDREQAQWFYFENFKIDGAEVFNAFVSDFLCHHPDYMPDYIKGFKKGRKHFDKAYRVKIPAPDQVKVVSDFYNNELKVNIQSIPLIYSIENIKDMGFESGMLSAYSRFEDDYKVQFEEMLPQQSGEAEYEEKGWFQVGLRFADGTIQNDPENRPSYKQVTIDAGLRPNLRGYVSATYGNNKNEKNIFASLKKMQLLYDHCIKNKIPLSDWFLEEYNKLK